MRFQKFCKYTSVAKDLFYSLNGPHNLDALNIIWVAYAILKSNDCKNRVTFVDASYLIDDN